MVKCPWCGREVSAEEYSKHLETCPQYERPSEAPSAKKSSETYESEEWKSFKQHLGETVKKNLHEHPNIADQIFSFVVNKFPLESNAPIQRVFPHLIKMLDGPPLTLEISRRKKFKPLLDGYAGIEGKVIVTISEAQKDEIPAEDIIALLIHEITHQKYPDLYESEVDDLSITTWKNLFPTEPLPSWLEAHRRVEAWKERVIK